jgi:hypothetical protein
MSLIHFTNPTDIPAYRDSGLTVQPALITLRTADMLDTYDRYLERHRRYYSAIPKKWPRYKEAERIAQLREELAQAQLEGRSITLDADDHIWSMSIEWMLGLRFVSAQCPACDRTYGPEECEVQGWDAGEGLAACGGRSVLCPGGHVLYSITEWNS